MEEYIDILNDAGEKTGEKRTRGDVHALGLTHRAVHVWVMNLDKEIILQKRSPKMITFPGLWDISASGHVSAGQTSLEAAKRETEEELGLFLPESSFKFLFSVEEHIVINNGTYINNEFQDIYLVQVDNNQKFNPDIGGEVSEVRWFSFEELEKLMSEEGDMAPRAEYKKLLEYLLD